MVSHELRTPLTSIHGFAALLASSDLTTEESCEYASLVFGQAQHLSRLVDDILVVLRMDSGTLPIQLQDVDVRDIGNLVKSTMELPSDKTLSTQIDEAAMVRADPDRLFQVLRNLVENALKYGGSHIELEARLVDDRIAIRVADNGAGIPPDRVTEIFSEYTQLEETGATTTSGFGLGLSIVKRLTEAMNGTVTYEPSRWGGACFVIDLPTSSLSIPAPGPH
jgi:signal transduction histidine kinase